MLTSRRLFLAVSLTALLLITSCSPSWLVDPLSDYLKKKTGLEVQLGDFRIGFGDQSLELKRIVLKYNQGPSTWQATIPEAKIFLGWRFFEEDGFWPALRIKHIALKQAIVSAKLPETPRKVDWLARLKKIPAFEQLTISSLQASLVAGRNSIQIAPGMMVTASFSPGQGGKLDFQQMKLKAQLPRLTIGFHGLFEGHLELQEFPDPPRWQGFSSFSDLQFKNQGVLLNSPQGKFDYSGEGYSFRSASSRIQVDKILWSGSQGSFQAVGRIDFSGSGLSPEGGLLKAQLSKGEMTWDDLDFLWTRGNKSITGRARGGLTLSGPLKGVQITGQFRTSKTDLKLPPVQATGLETDLAFQGKATDLGFFRVWAKASQAQWRSPPGPLFILNPETRFSAKWKQKERHLQLDDIFLKTENWGNLSGNLFFDFPTSPFPGGMAKSQNFPLKSALGFLFPHWTQYLPEEPVGEISLSWQSPGAGEPVPFQLALLPPALHLSDPGRIWEAEEIQTRISIAGRWSPQSRDWKLVGTQKITGGIFSLSPWLVPFNRDPLEARFEGTVLKNKGKDPGSSIEGSFDLRYAPLGQGKGQGVFSWTDSSRTCSGQVEIKDLATEKAYPLFVGQPLAFEHPFLETISLQGPLAARLQVSLDGKDHLFRGYISSPGLSLKNLKPQLNLEGIAFDLPFFFSSNPQESPLAEPELGFLTLGALQGPGLAAGPLVLPVRSDLNFFEILGEPALSLWGGRMTFRNLKLQYPRKKFTLTAGLTIQGVQLDQLLSERRITGRLNGGFDPVIMTEDQATFQGSLSADLFEGTVEGENWVVTRPLSPNRRISGDLYFRHINLEPLTGLFSFGKITGYLEGKMTGLSLVYNQLERFDLNLRTERVPGTPQRISLRAIENISLLGTGSGELDILSQGINRWIQEYYYGEIGISCKLQGDRLQVRGTIFEEGEEYLVRKPGLLGIDVINKNPNNEIEFSDIVERLKRMKRPRSPGGEDEKK